MKSKHWVLLFFILLKITLQYFAIDPIYELQRDEYLHLDLGKHLAFGYSSVPPLTGLLSYVINLLGYTVFWIKFFPTLFGVLTMLVVWKIVEELEGGLFALVLASMSVTLSVLLRLNTLYQPNSLEVLLWTTLLYTLVKHVKSNDVRWIYAASIVFAIGFLNKYNIAFLMLGLLPALLVTPLRKVFATKHFYFGAVLSFILILPNLIWQYNNNFPVYQHLKLLAESQLVNVNRTDFLVEQLFFFTGSLLVILAAFISFFSYKPFIKYRFLFFTFVFTMVLFVYFRAKNYYAIGLYPVFLAFGAVYLEYLTRNGWWKYSRAVLILIPVVTMISTYKLLLPVLSPDEIIKQKELFEKLNMNRWEDGKMHELPQDYADMLGWKELGALVDSAFTLIDEKNSTIIQCDNYGQAGAINFYSNQPYTEALTMNADYINWYPLDEMTIINAILVKEANDDEDWDRINVLFEEVRYIGQVSNKYSREKGTKVYLAIGAKQSINDILREEIQNLKGSSNAPNENQH